MVPIESNGSGAQPDDSKGDTVWSIREAATEIELNIGSCARAGDLWAKGFESELGLAQASAHCRSGNERARGHGERREVLVVDSSSSGKEIEKHDTRETDAIFRSALYFRLILIINFGGEQLLIFFQFCQMLRDRLLFTGLRPTHGRRARTVFRKRAWAIGRLTARLQFPA